jgi:hypothetical protein
MDLQEMIAEANSRLAAMSPVDRAIHHFRQRASFVRGELALGLDDGKGYSTEQIARIPKDEGTVLCDEVESQRTTLSAYRALLEKAAASLAPFAHDAQFMEKGHPDRPAWALYSGSAAFANRDRYKVVRQSFDDARATLASIREALGKGREG